jgi:hypothetical protein
VLLSIVERRIEQSQSPLSFIVEGGGSWPQWDRYLAIEGKKAFHIGNICGTCGFFFERLEGANQSVNPEEVVEALNKGVGELDPDFLTCLEKIIPSGEYKVLLSRVTPRLVSPGDENDYFTHEQVSLWGVDPFWEMPHFPKTEYYRLATKPLPNKRGLFEFLIPTFPHRWLDTKRVAEYQGLFQHGVTPTAVAISVLDVKGPADWHGEDIPIVEHFCLAHYLVDGHHKVYAAAKSCSPITLISFLTLEHGIASSEEIGMALTELKEA